MAADKPLIELTGPDEPLLDAMVRALVKTGRAGAAEASSGFGQGGRHAWDTATNLAGRGLAATAGAPVDLVHGGANLVRAIKGLSKYAVSGKASDLDELDDTEQTGGSAWMGRKLTDAGLMTGERFPVLEMTSQLASPLAGKAGVKAAQLAEKGIEVAPKVARDVALAASLRREAPPLSNAPRQRPVAAARVRSGKDDVRADVEDAVAQAEEPQVPRSRAALRAAGMEPEMIASFMTQHSGETVPESLVKTAVGNRATYRAESPALPKRAAEMTPEEMAAWGQEHGVNMTVTPHQGIGVMDAAGNEIQIPGGLEGTFSIPDLFAIKSRNINPKLLPDAVHEALMQKFIRTYGRGGAELSPVEKYNALLFSQTSPKTPLLPNEFLTQRFRVRTPEELDQMARTDPKVLKGEDTGVGAAWTGGLGVRSTPDLGNIAKLAREMRDNPDAYVPLQGETVRDVGRRVMNLIPGQSMKTASLGVPWFDLARGNTSAMDLHMIEDSYRDLLKDPQHGEAFRSRLANMMGTPDASVDELIAAAAADPKGYGAKQGDMAIKIVGGDVKQPVYRLASGELNPELNPAVLPDKLGTAKEPKKAKEFGPLYDRSVELVSEGGNEYPSLDIFPRQWARWDRIRGRIEPHEVMHPDYLKLPRMSFTELQDALKANKAAGYSNKNFKPDTQKSEEEAIPWWHLFHSQADPATGVDAGNADLTDKLLRAMRADQAMA